MRMVLDAVIKDLREGGALCPDGAVVAYDCGRGEDVALGIAHKVLVNVGLPRHPRNSPMRTFRLQLLRSVVCVERDVCV